MLITYTAMEHVGPDGGPVYDKAKLEHHGIEPHEKEKLDAMEIKPQHDPLEVEVCGVKFKHGEAVKVDPDHPVVAILAGNPWFDIRSSKRSKKESDSDNS